MNEKALAQLDADQGVGVGVGPSIVMVDDRMARTLTNKTISEDIYAFMFQHSGLMAGVGLLGTKITRIQPK